MEDHEVHNLDDNTGTGDFTDESMTSGDSAVVLGCKLPSLTSASRNSQETYMYKKLDLNTMNAIHPYDATLTDVRRKRTESKESI